MPGGALRVGIAGGLGTFSSLLGIGGGTIAIMVMTLCGRTIHRAVGTASGIGTLIAIPSAIGFATDRTEGTGAALGFGRLCQPAGHVRDRLDGHTDRALSALPQRTRWSPGC